MEVITAETAGFCFGVERAVNTVYDALSNEDVIYTYGPIIHNESVVEELDQKGVKIINSLEELKEITYGTVIIRSHGVTRQVYEILENNGLKYIDATCPFVLKIHRLVDEAAKDGCHIIIAGDRTHPEVEGILSFAGENVTVIQNEAEAEGFEAAEDSKLFMVAQTTFNSNIFNKFVEIFNKKYYNISIVNTICNSTALRQKETAELAEMVDAMIVIGGTHSSNTRKLYDIAKSKCEHTIFVQTLDDLILRKDDIPLRASCVGITAGASTPKKIIEEVQNYVRRFWPNVG
ncbi:MAG: 4-hydroxy-3-methylbut-2-enyl diphosphate reductase [Lachnospiraceae bacterium]|nr:4-hydroxy-3-methylbut-2-enyl diphosphate reductase [Lachnospiraceae bacterium]